jgi:hypothetical protein
MSVSIQRTPPERSRFAASEVRFPWVSSLPETDTEFSIHTDIRHPGGAARGLRRCSPRSLRKTQPKAAVSVPNDPGDLPDGGEPPIEPIEGDESSVHAIERAPAQIKPKEHHVSTIATTTWVNRSEVGGGPGKGASEAETAGRRGGQGRPAPGPV